MAHAINGYVIYSDILLSTNQTITQRAMAAPTVKEAQKVSMPQRLYGWCLFRLWW